MRSLSFGQLFSLLFISAAGLLAASMLSAWTGPASAPPNGNVAAPINVGTADQIKDGGVGFDALAVYGTQYIEEKLGIGRTSPVVALDVNGSVRIANGGEVCQAVTAGSIRFNSSSSVIEYCNGSSWQSFGGGSTPSGAVMAFNLSTCPSGWNEYTAAYGRFIRGIDKSGTSIDPSGQRAPGNTQADELKAHSHTVNVPVNNPNMPNPPYGYEQQPGWPYQVENQNISSASTGGAETRPKNVALLYCEKL